MNWFLVGVVFSGVAFLVYGGLCLFTDSMKEEFARFGLARFRVLTGFLEVLGGAGLLIGLWCKPALLLASAGLTVLMLLGVGVRLRCRDGIFQTLPALLLFFLNLYIFWTSWSIEALLIGTAVVFALIPALRSYIEPAGRQRLLVHSPVNQAV